MTHFVDLDVSQKMTAVCVVDVTGIRIWRGTCASSPEQIEAAVRCHADSNARIDVETGPMTPSGASPLLMQAGIDWLGADKSLWLNVIRHNARAIRFYRRLGFEIDPDAMTGHAVPHWIMRRRARADASSP